MKSLYYTDTKLFSFEPILGGFIGETTKEKAAKFAKLIDSKYSPRPSLEIIKEEWKSFNKIRI